MLKNIGSTLSPISFLIAMEGTDSYSNLKIIDSAFDGFIDASIKASNVHILVERSNFTNIFSAISYFIFIENTAGVYSEIILKDIIIQ